jgi:hypothetical protein
MAYVPVTLGDQDTVQVLTAFGGGETPTLAINAVNLVGGATSTSQIINSGTLDVVGFSTFSSSIYVGGDLQVAGISTFVGNVTFKGGTIGLGDSNTDSIVFTGDVNSSIVPNIDDAFDLGSILQKWRNIYLNVGVGKTYGIAYFGADSQLVATATPSVGIQTTNLLLTVDENNVPVWTDSIDGGFY